MAAADRNGHVAAVSLGPAATLLGARRPRSAARKRLVVADLPGGVQGYRDLRALSAARPPGGLLIVVQRVAHAPGTTAVAAAAVGPPRAPGERSADERERQARSR